VHEISGTGWRLSFQRRVGRGQSANRGALPLRLTRDSGRTRALVPLPDGETVWLAVVCSEHIRVTAETSAGEHMPTTVVAKCEDDALIALDAIVRNGLSIPIDSSAVDRSDGEKPDREHLAITIISRETEASAIGVTFVTPACYKLKTGTGVPTTSAADAFDGRLLP
jgi:hypothetical protein